MSHTEHFELLLDTVPRLLRQFNEDERLYGSNSSTTVAVRSVQQALSANRNGGTAIGGNLYVISQCGTGNGYGRVGR